MILSWKHQLPSLGCNGTHIVMVSSQPKEQVYHLNVKDNQESDKQLKRFRSIENLTDNKILSEEELLCEKHFISTSLRVLRVVILYLCHRNKALGFCKRQVLNTFYQLEHKLQSALTQQYKQFMTEYQALGHVEPQRTISSCNSQIKQCDH